MMKKKVSLATTLMLVLLAVTATANVFILGMGEFYSDKLGDVQNTESEYRRLKELEEVIGRYFVGEFEGDTAMDGALAGYVNGLGDKWSSYYTEEQYQLLLKQQENSYYGIGVTISTEVSEGYSIISVVPGGPAEKAGLKVLDVITDIDGVSISEFATYTDVVNVVRGEEGTIVNIGVRRGDQLLHFDIARGTVYNQGVEYEMMPQNIAYFYISGFDKNVDVEFNSKLNEALAQGAKGLIFDVRFNGGGYVDVMCNMLDPLLPEGTIISMSDKKGKTTEYKSKADCLDIPIVVLTNEYSISAAEFFAAVLQEYGVGQVVGNHTTGKGYAQNLIPLEKGAVNLSTAKYYTPKGVSLAGAGVVPDYDVSLSEESMYNFYYLTPEEDTQLQKALEVMGNILAE